MKTWRGVLRDRLVSCHNLLQNICPFSCISEVSWLLQVLGISLGGGEHVGNLAATRVETAPTDASWQGDTAQHKEDNNDHNTKDDCHQGQSGLVIPLSKILSKMVNISAECLLHFISGEQSRSNGFQEWQQRVWNLRVVCEYIFGSESKVVFKCSCGVKSEHVCVTCGDVSSQNVLNNMFQTFGDRTIVFIIAAINLHKDGTGVCTENVRQVIFSKSLERRGGYSLSVKLHSISADTLGLATLKVHSKLPTITCLVAWKLNNLFNLPDLEMNNIICGLCRAWL